MIEDLAGKTALITGAAGGIGLGTAKVFAHAGMKVVITDIKDDQLIVLDVCNDHLHASVGKHLGSAKADATSSSSDQCCLACKILDQSSFTLFSSIRSKSIS